jgi:hypothetical protein
VLELFFDSSGIVHEEFIPEEATVNKHHYKQIVCHLCSSVHLMCTGLWHRNNWLLLHDNASTHHSVLVEEELAKITGRHFATLPIFT